MPKQITGPLALTAAAQPTNANWSSQEFSGSGIDTVSFIIKTQGVTQASGEFKVMAKNHKDGAWAELTLSPACVLSNASSETKPILVTSLCFTSVRLDFIRGNALDDGTFSVWMQGEGDA